MSMKNIESGDFERIFTEVFSLEIQNGEPITNELIRSCYVKAGKELGLSPMPSDELRIADLSALLKKNEVEMIRLNSDALREKIFGLIFEK